VLHKPPHAHHHEKPYGKFDEKSVLDKHFPQFSAINTGYHKCFSKKPKRTKTTFDQTNKKKGDKERNQKVQKSDQTFDVSN
jgi:hypothetical protein